MPTPDLLPHPLTASFPVPDGAGIFSTYESIPIAGLPVKCAGELMITEAGVEEFYVGWFLVMRQPANTSKELPHRREPRFRSRRAALTWLIDEIAAKFFFDHKVARERVKAWRALVLGAEEEAVELEVPNPIVAWVDATLANPVTPLDVKGPDTTASTPVVSMVGFIPVCEIEPNPHNPRREVDEGELVELAESIRAQGFLLQPIAVRDMGAEANPRYRLISGFRRWLAHQRLKWDMIESKVFVGVDDARAGELALVENLQRVRLNAMEEALGFVELRDRYGYDVAKIHERTGKAESTIRNAFRVAALPAEVCALVRAGTLPVHAAKLLASPRWAQRPEHCRALAEWIVRAEVSRAELDAGIVDRLAASAAEALSAAKLAVEISAYRSMIEPDDFRERGQREAGSEIVEDRTGRLWHLAPAQWKAEKAEIDRETKQKEEAEAAKAAARAKVALTEKVNVRTEDLTRGHLAYVALMGPDARYAAHLPTELVAEGVDDDEKEIVVCLKPEALKALKVREAELIEADTAAKLPALVDRAVATIKRVKKITGRELALVVDGMTRGQMTAMFDGKAFELLGVTLPETGLTREELARMEPVDLVRVMMLSVVLNTKSGVLYETLRWVLGIEDLGLVEESDERKATLLAAAASEVFPPTENDAKRLAEWSRAHALGMPVAEIARSYGATESDVRGALGLNT